jgi:hypothetical protein
VEIPNDLQGHGGPATVTQTLDCVTAAVEVCWRPPASLSVQHHARIGGRLRITDITAGLETGPRLCHGCSEFRCSVEAGHRTTSVFDSADRRRRHSTCRSAE